MDRSLKAAGRSFSNKKKVIKEVSTESEEESQTETN
jgi:hypothetical protein